MKKITLLAGFVAIVFTLIRPVTVLAADAAGGEIIWSVDLTYTPATAAPRVAPSGNIYIHSDDLYAISPTGQILWRKNSADPKGGGCRSRRDSLFRLRRDDFCLHAGWPVALELYRAARGSGSDGGADRGSGR